MVVWGLFGDLESALRSGEDIDTAGQVGQRVSLGDFTAQKDAAGGVDVDGSLVGDAMLFGSDILNAGKHVVNVLEEDDGMLGSFSAGVYVSVVFRYRGSLGISELGKHLVVGLYERIMAFAYDMVVGKYTGQEIAGIGVGILVVGGMAYEGFKIGVVGSGSAGRSCKGALGLRADFLRLGLDFLHQFVLHYIGSVGLQGRYGVGELNHMVEIFLVLILLEDFRGLLIATLFLVNLIEDVILAVLVYVGADIAFRNVEGKNHSVPVLGEVHLHGLLGLVLRTIVGEMDVVEEESCFGSLIILHFEVYGEAAPAYGNIEFMLNIRFILENVKNGIDVVDFIAVIIFLKDVVGKACEIG